MSVMGHEHRRLCLSRRRDGHPRPRASAPCGSRPRIASRGPARQVNTQIAFVESGQINGVWPPYDGGLVWVEAVPRHALPPDIKEFYGLARDVMDNANIDPTLHLRDVRPAKPGSRPRQG